MWLYLGFENYLGKVVVKEGFYKFSVTNLLTIWESLVNQHDVIQIFKERNPIFEMKNDAALEKVLDLYRNYGARHTIEALDDVVTVTSKSEIGSFPFSFSISLQRCDNQKLYEELTRPVLGLLEHVYHQREKLLDIIRAKDVEIQQYKEEGAELKRRGVITAPFSYESVQSVNILPSNQPGSIFRGQLQKDLAAFLPPDSPDKALVSEKSTLATENAPETKVPVIAAKREPSVSCLISAAPATKRPKKPALRL